MQRVRCMVENPWHMLPLIFLDAIHVDKSKSNRPKGVQDFIDAVLSSAKATSDNRRYKPAFEYVTQPEKFLHKVAAGYAANPTYESKLIPIMRSYDFYKYD